MIGIPFYNKTIRDTVAVFGSLFNNIVIERKDGKIIPVPISYGPRDKWREAQKALEADEVMFEKLLPRMSYEVVAMNYDINRKLTNKQFVIAKNDGSKLQKIAAPVPYILDFTLYIQTKSLNDGWQIIEQILPFFTPAYTVRVRNFPIDRDSDTPIPENEYDVPFILSAVTWADDWTGDIQDRRVIEWTLEFQSKIFLYGPINPRPAEVIVDARGIVSLPPDSNTDTRDMNRTSPQAGSEVGFAKLQTTDSEAFYDSDSNISPTIINTSDSDGNITSLYREIDNI